MHPQVALIAAMSENRVIGRGNALPWHLPTDLKHFKDLTTGHTVIMGRKTFESLRRPLPNRRSIVISRNSKFHPAAVEVVHSLIEALRLADNAGDVFIIGGEQIFREALPAADLLYLTIIHANIEGDVFFPEFDVKQWKLTQDARHEANEKNSFPLSFRTYERIRK